MLNDDMSILDDKDKSDSRLHKVVFELNISAQEYLQFYQGSVSSVLVNSFCGKKVQFPANRLQGYVTQSGIYGRFVLIYTNSGKVVELTKIN